MVLNAFECGLAVRFSKAALDAIQVIKKHSEDSLAKKTSPAETAVDLTAVSSTPNAVEKKVGATSGKKKN